MDLGSIKHFSQMRVDDFYTELILWGCQLRGDPELP